MRWNALKENVSSGHNLPDQFDLNLKIQTHKRKNPVLLGRNLSKLLVHVPLDTLWIPVLYTSLWLYINNCVCDWNMNTQHRPLVCMDMEKLRKMFTEPWARWIWSLLSVHYVYTDKVIYSGTHQSIIFVALKFKKGIIINHNTRLMCMWDMYQIQEEITDEKHQEPGGKYWDVVSFKQNAWVSSL